MKFTTPCFNIYIQVRVEDVKKRKELIGWLFSIGYALCGHLIGMDGETPVVVAAFGKFDLWVRTHYKSETCFDCGENIELFKALAAMNDENDLDQWFINDAYANIGCVMWHLCDEKKFKHYYVDWEDGATDIRSDFRKATVEEIIEQFKEK